jgi:hypothetical protein
MPASSWNFWLGLFASAGFVAGFIVAVLRWGHNQIVKSVEERIATVRSAVTPNGGSSMADAVNRIETKLQNIGERQKDIKAELDAIKEDMDEIGLKLERHLGAHEGLA